MDGKPQLRVSKSFLVTKKFKLTTLLFARHAVGKMCEFAQDYHKTIKHVHHAKCCTDSSTLQWGALPQIIQTNKSDLSKASNCARQYAGMLSALISVSK